MILTQEEIDILRIYIADSYEATIHNLSVAASYFKPSPQSIVYSRLLSKIREMDTTEYHSIKFMLH